MRRRTGNTSTAGPPTEARAAGSPLGGELFYDSVSFRTCSVTVQCNAYARKPSTRALNVSRSYSIIFGLLMHSLARSRRWPARLQPQPAFAAACRAYVRIASQTRSPWPMSGFIQHYSSTILTNAGVAQEAGSRLSDSKATAALTRGLAGMSSVCFARRMRRHRESQDPNATPVGARPAQGFLSVHAAVHRTLNLQASNAI